MIYTTVMLYTGKGDDGTTGLFGRDQRIAKSSAIAEALGSVDEINSFLGLVKMDGSDTQAVDNLTFSELLLLVQQDLFVLQAELAGSDKKIVILQVQRIEKWIAQIEEVLPPITSFLISGGTRLAANCDVARTIARRAERRVVAVVEQDNVKHPEMLQYMNRPSSLLYALARLINFREGVVEEKPHY